MTALTKQDLQVVASLVSALLNERPTPVGLAAHVVPGSYRQQDGTVEVSIDDTDAAYQLANALGDPDVNQLLIHPRVPIAAVDPNQQYGPRGGEAVVLLPSQAGYHAFYCPDADTEEAPGPGPFFSVRAPSGHHWIMHRNASGQIDSAIKLTNDGPTPGDGLGGTIVGNAGALTQLETNSGHAVTLNDTTKQVRVQTAGVGNPSPVTAIFDDPSQTLKTAVASAIFALLDAINQKIVHQAGTQVSTTLINTNTVQQIIHRAAANVQTIIDGAIQKITHQASPNVKTIVDAAGNAISHVIGSGGTVSLGAIAGSGSLIPAITKNDLTSMITDSGTGINIQRLQDMRTIMAALVNACGGGVVAGWPSLGTLNAAVWAVLGISPPTLPGYAQIPVPSGSATVSMLP